MRYPIIALTLVLLTQRPAIAGGSVEWSQVEPTVAENPAVYNFVNAALQINPHGMASRFGWHQKHLGGARIGPYEFSAHRKGIAGPDDLTLTVCTVPTFYDENGRITTWEAAASFTEQLAFIAVTRRGSRQVICPVWAGDP